MEIELRDYQNKVSAEIRKQIKLKKKHILTQLPTGGGKTVIFSYISLNAAGKNNRVLIITDREELLGQAGKTIRKFDLNPAFIKAGTKHLDRRKNIFIAMSQTLRNRIAIKEWRDFIQFEIDIIIIDEAHIQEFNYLFEDGILDDKLVLGFTATPTRSGKQRQLGLDYDVMVRGAETKDLIKLGYLLNCDLYEVDSPNLDGVKVNPLSGDFNENSMFEKFNKAKTYAGLLTNYKQIADGKKMLVFCCNIEHAIKTTIELSNAGYKTKFIVSELTPPKQKLNPTEAEKAQYSERLKKYQFYKENFPKHSGPRKKMIEDFESGEITILVNVDMLTKGFDDSSVEVVATLRATLSTSLWLQMLGRGARIDEKIGKSHFIALDFGGNAKRLGNYEDNRNWSLWHEERKGNGVPPLKECGLTSKGKPIKSANEITKGCTRLILAMYQQCPFCGFKYPEKKEAAEVELSLQQIMDENGQVLIKTKSISLMTFKELTEYRQSKNHKQAWLWRQLWIRNKEQTLRDYAKENFWSESVIQRALNYCKQNLT